MCLFRRCVFFFKKIFFAMSQRFDERQFNSGTVLGALENALCMFNMTFLCG